jgi:hypothetical protein
LWEAYQHDVQFLRAGDWLVMENGNGSVPIAATGARPMTATDVRLDVATNTEGRHPHLPHRDRRAGSDRERRGFGRAVWRAVGTAT